MERAAAARLILTISLTGATAAQAGLIVPQGVSGDLEYSYRNSRYENSYATSSNMLTGRLATHAYLWQPWLATMNFSLALTQDHTSTSAGTETNGHFTTGEANLNVLPASRYPFAARYVVSDSRLDSSSANDNPLLAQSTARQFTRNQLLLTQGAHGQSYRLNLRYNQDEAKSDLGEEYTQQGYGFDYSLRGNKQNLSATALFQNQANNQNSNESDNTVVSLNHNYYPSSYTTLDSLASHVKSNNYYTASLTGLTQQVTSTIDQASTSLGWRSSTRPLRLHGGLRVHQMDYLLESGTTSNTLNSEGLNTSLGASYQFTERLMGSVGGQYGALRSDTSDVRAHNENAALSYSSERSSISDFDYGWNSSLSGSNQQSGESRAQVATLALGHSATRSWSLERRSSMRLSLSQTLEEGYTHSSGPAVIGYTGGMSGETRRLAHAINLGWMGSDLTGSSLAQLTITDSRGILGDESRSQMVNAQLSRSQLLDNRSSLNGNLTWQAWHYILPGTPDYGIGQTTTASASYRYARPFTLQRVAFVSDLRLTDIQPAIGSGTQETFWDNRFTHEIGLMRSSLGLTFRDHLGIESTMLMASVKRMF
ncbi:MAG TPA: hypothetical protein VGE00_09280 [Gammaproteobacteria bacterium]